MRIESSVLFFYAVFVHVVSCHACIHATACSDNNASAFIHLGHGGIQTFFVRLSRTGVKIGKRTCGSKLFLSNSGQISSNVLQKPVLNVPQARLWRRD